FVLKNIKKTYLRELKSYLSDLQRPDIVYIEPPPRIQSVKKENLRILRKAVDSGFEYLKYKNFNDYRNKELRYLKRFWHNALPFFWLELLDINDIKADIRESEAFNDKKDIKFYNNVIKKLKDLPYVYTRRAIYTKRIHLRLLKSIVMEILRRRRVYGITERALQFHLYIHFDEI
ncbi:MAG: hypothetical protein ABIL69_07705, partial [candidate division WOR-3 bacterium]